MKITSTSVPKTSNYSSQNQLENYQELNIAPILFGMKKEKGFADKDLTEALCITNKENRELIINNKYRVATFKYDIEPKTIYLSSRACSKGKDFITIALSEEERLKEHRKYLNMFLKVVSHNENNINTIKIHTQLSISELDELFDLIAKDLRITQLILCKNIQITDEILRKIAQLTHLTKLILENCKELTCMSMLNNIPSLKKFTLSMCGKIKETTRLSRFSKLEVKYDNYQNIILIDGNIDNQDIESLSKQICYMIIEPICKH